MLTPLQPYQSSFGPMEFVALLLMAGCAVVGWKRRSRLVGLGFAFFFCSLAPVLFIPYLPTRYTTAPLIGFVLVLAGVRRRRSPPGPARANPRESSVPGDAEAAGRQRLQIKTNRAVYAVLTASC